MNVNAIVTLALVAVGVGLIVIGAVISLREWRKTFEGKTSAESHALGSTLTGLAKVLEALKGYPTGQRLIVFGIIVLIISGLFGGISGL